MTDYKICTKCNQPKEINKDFYFYSGNARHQCKACIIKQNIKYQRRVKPWKFKDNDRRSYMREYYNKNKIKFSQYRENFKKIHPDYYKEYFRKYKEKNGD